MVYVLCRTFPLWIFRKKWWVMAVANVLGFYTHTYMIFVPIAQGIHWLCSRHRVIKFLHASALTILLMLPWFFRVIREMPKLKNTWYFPVDIHLVQSVLGNMFIGYEGTPWFLWNVTAYLSLGLLALFLFSLEPKTTQPRNLFLHTMTCSRSPWSSAFPFKPLFVNRYLIPVTITEVFLVAFAIEAIQNHLVQKLLLCFCFALGLTSGILRSTPKLTSENADGGQCTARQTGYYRRGKPVGIF